MMKKIHLSVLFFLALAITPAFAQDEPEDIPGEAGNNKFNFFGGMLIEPSFFDDHTAVSMGATMGVSYIGHVYAGIYYVSMVSQHYRDQLPDWEGKNLRGSLNHGGLIAGYVFMPQRLTNISLNARVGWGSVWFYDDRESSSYTLNELYRGTRDRLIILTPGLEYSFTPINWLKIGLGMGYRMTFMVDRYGKNEFNSLVGTISISFGGFRTNAFGEPAETYDK